MALTKLDVKGIKDGTDGQLITWDASAIADTVATGGSTQVLTAQGAGAANFFHVAKTVQVPADSSLILDKPINLRNANSVASGGDLIRATASATGDLQAFVSVLQITN